LNKGKTLDFASSGSTAGASDSVWQLNDVPDV